MEEDRMLPIIWVIFGLGPSICKCFKNQFGECREKSNKCYTCGGNGHFSGECPSKNVGMGARQNNQVPSATAGTTSRVVILSGF